MAYVVIRTHFYALRARGVCEAGFFSWINFFFRDGSNEVSHAPGRVREVGFAEDPGRDPGTDPGTDPDRENGHYADIDIDIYAILDASTVEISLSRPKRSF